MARTDRLAIARWAIETLPSKVKANGQFHPADPTQPKHWIWSTGGLTTCLAEGVLQAPGDAALCDMLDVWQEGKGKVLAVAWSPAQPWMPPRLSALKASDWMEALGWQRAT